MTRATFANITDPATTALDIGVAPGLPTKMEKIVQRLVGQGRSKVVPDE